MNIRDYSRLQDAFADWHENAEADWWPERRRVMDATLARIEAGRSPLVVQGTAGVGKSAFLTSLAKALDPHRKTTLVSATGVPSAAATAADGTAKPLAPDDAPAHSAQPAVLLIDDLHLADEWWVRRVAAPCPDCQAPDALQPRAQLVVTTDRRSLRAGLPGLGGEDDIGADNCFVLNPMTRSDVEAFVAARLRRAGYDGPSPFTEEAMGRIEFYSRGLPGRITRLCRAALSVAEERAVWPVGEALVREVAWSLFLPESLKDRLPALGHGRPEADAAQIEMASAASSPHAAGGADADTADSDSSAGVPGAALSEPVAAPTGRRLRSAARPLVLAAVACFAIGIGVAVHVAPDGAGPPALPRQVASDIDPETPPAVPRDAVADVVDQSLPEPAPEPAVAAAAPPAEPVAETLSEAPTGGQMMLPEEIETAAPAGDPPPDVAEILEPTAPATAVDAAPPTTAGAVAPERKRRIAARAPRRAPSDRVATAQSLLTQLGFSPGPIDGAEGPRTRRAIRAYQTRRGLAVTGAVDDRVLASLRRDAASQPPRPGSPSLLTSVIRTISATVGPRVDSVREPGSVVRYCRNNRDTWVYDFGKDRPVFCKYIDQPGG